VSNGCRLGNHDRDEALFTAENRITHRRHRLFPVHFPRHVHPLMDWRMGGSSRINCILDFCIRYFRNILPCFQVYSQSYRHRSNNFLLCQKELSSPTTFKVLRWILVLEALYWLGLLVSGIWGVMPVSVTVTDYILTLQFNLTLLITTGIPCLVSSITIPIALFKIASKLNPNKPPKDAIKWGLIAGTVYVFVFWLNNTGMWIATIMSKGTEFLTTYPENLLSFTLTSIGLLALAVFTAHFTKKSIGTETLEKLKLRTLGAIIVALGLYFLWNYLTWIFFGGWSDWYAWFLGHNLDLWLLSLPLVGLPLLFKRQAS